MNGKGLRLGLLPLCAAGLLFTIAVYPALPEQFPIHWNIQGVPNGWGDKQWAAFVLPGMIGLLLPFQAFFDMRRNTGEDADVRSYIMTLIGWLFAMIQALAVRTALCPNLSDTPILLTSGMLALMAAMGNVLGKVSRNGFIGIRTPWTLENDAVWRATHRLAARLMTLIGAIGAVAVWFGVPPKICWLGFVVAALIPAAYSYPLYVRYTSEGKE